MKKFLAFLFGLLILPSLAFAQYGPPNPWVVNGSSISYSAGGVLIGATVTGGSQGPGTLNAMGLYVSGHPVLTSVSALVDAVSNSDGSLTISPTTGNVVASIATAHKNIWTVAQEISLNAGSLQAAQTGAVLQLGGVAATISRLEQDSYAAPGIFTCVRADGTAASPTTLQAADEICSLNGFGYNGAAFVGPRAAFRTYADQNWTTGANGTYADIATTPDGSTTMAEVAKFHNDGGVVFGSTGTDEGAGTLNLTGGGLYNNGTAPTGTGAYVRATSPTLVTPTLGVAQGTSLALAAGTTGAPALNFGTSTVGLGMPTAGCVSIMAVVGETSRFCQSLTSLTVVGANSLALGGASIGSNALAATGTANVSGSITGAGLIVTGSGIPANGVYLPAANTLGLSANSAQALTLGATGTYAAWTTNGIAIIQPPLTFTDSSSSGTVANVYVNNYGAATLAASSATTYTNAYANVFNPPTAGTNVTLTISYAALFNGRVSLGTNNISSVGSILGAGGNAFELVNSAASSTVPTLLPNRAATTTGIGAQASGNISEIVSAAEVGRWTSTGLNNAAIGQTTPLAGAFTTLSASGATITLGNAAFANCSALTTVSNVVGCGAAGSGNALFGTTSGNVANNIVTMSNTTVGVKDSGVAVPVGVTSFTPTDASGGSLPFGFARGWYTVFNRYLSYHVEVQYPTTSDTNLARIGGLPIASTTTFTNPQAGTAETSGGFVIYGTQIAPNTTNFAINALNSTLSTQTVLVNGGYYIN